MKKLVVWATFAAAGLATTAAFVTAGPVTTGPARQMPVTDVPAQRMPAGLHVDDEPMSVKPDAGIQWDGGAPLPPIPDGGPLPQTRDASVPLQGQTVPL